MGESLMSKRFLVIILASIASLVFGKAALKCIDKETGKENYLGHSYILGTDNFCESHCREDECLTAGSTVCVKRSIVFLSTGSDNKCRNRCNVNECYDENFICREYLDSDDKKLKKCTKLARKLIESNCKISNQCLNEIGVCVDAELSKISDNDGSCKTKCSDDKKCFDSHYICRSPDPSNISNGDGGSCLSHCSNDKCSNELFICVKLDETHVSKSLGGSCLASCDTDECFGSDFICVAPDTQKISAGDGGKCIFGCDESKCLNSQNVCQYPDASNLLDYPSIRCVSKCKPERSNCYDPATFVCQVPTEDHLSLGNGLVCIVPNC